jgi:hypothetical protein
MSRLPFLYAGLLFFCAVVWAVVYLVVGALLPQ